MALTRLTLLSSDLKIVGFAGYRYYKNTYVGEVGYAKVAAQSPAKEKPPSGPCRSYWRKSNATHSQQLCQS